jgi:hypothetical protein
MYWNCSATPGHLVASTHRQDLGEAAVEENALGHAIEADEVAQQLLVSFGRAGMKLGSESSCVWLIDHAAFLATDGTSRYILKTSPSSMPSDSMQY